MVKSKEEVIAQFNEEVNMTVDELEAWLADPKSEKAGTGVGIESGHKIIEILRKNPDKDATKYDDDDIEHMRKVVGYANRHLAQEDHLKETKTREELENAKSTISLKNWGHDVVKELDEEPGKADEGEQQSEEPNTDAETSEEPSAVNGEQKSDAPHKSKSAESTTGEEREEPDQTEAKKRKLDEDETNAADADQVKIKGNGVDGEVEAVEDDTQDDRPRKKSKVGGSE